MQAESARQMKKLIGLIQERHHSEWEVVAMEGDGYPGSIYKLHLRLGSGKWWQASIGVGQSPIKPYEGRLTRHLTMRDLAAYACHPEKEALVKVMAAIHQRLGT